MYHSLLVPLDGSDFAEQAIPYAVTIAKHAGAALQIVRVVPALPASSPSASRSGVLSGQQAQAYLDQVVEYRRSLSGIEIHAHLLESKAVAATICDHAVKTGVDLVVMTTHARGPLGRFWLGSAANDLLACLPMPTLLLHPKEHHPERAANVSMKHVLVALDGTPQSEAILESAVDIGTLMGADFTLLRVISDLPIGSSGMDSIAMSSASRGVLAQIRQLQKQQEAEAEKYLDTVAGPLRDRGLQVKTEIRVNISATDALLEMAAHYDLLAMESHGRRGLARLANGGVTRRLVQGATVPMLVHSAGAVRKASS